MPARRADADDATVGHNIRVQRLGKKMSQTALADAIGLTFQQVQKYEKGVNGVGAGRLVRVAAALDVPVMRLLDGVAGAAAPMRPRCAKAGRSPASSALSKARDAASSTSYQPVTFMTGRPSALARSTVFSCTRGVLHGISTNSFSWNADRPISV